MGAVRRWHSQQWEEKGGVSGKAVWEQRKWEKQDSLEDWAREGSPGTAGPEAGW